MQNLEKYFLVGLTGFFSRVISFGVRMETTILVDYYTHSKSLFLFLGFGFFMVVWWFVFLSSFYFIFFFFFFFTDLFFLFRPDSPPPTIPRFSISANQRHHHFQAPKRTPMFSRNSRRLYLCVPAVNPYPVRNCRWG